MAVNKNFVVKNGLEVDTNTLFVDSSNNRVAIGTTVPTATLDVRGNIKALDSQVDAWVGNYIGIVTAGAVGVTTVTTRDVNVSGFSTLGYANATSFNVTTGFSTVQGLSSLDLDVSIGATVTKDLNVGGATTVGGALTVTGYAYFGSNVDIAGDLTYDELNARNINVSGVGTIASLFHVGAAATMMVAQGIGNSSRVGISSAIPAWVLDVNGDINSSTGLRVGGINIETLYASTGDATALAIALG